MSIDCDFFTSEPNLFQDHLALHLHYQSPDERNILSCAYCTFKGQNSQTLVDHVVNEHGADLYQCTQCFYRSFDLQVVTHMKIHHKTQPLKVIKCRVMKEKDKSEEMSQVWEQCSVNVPVITCMSK